MTKITIDKDLIEQAIEALPDVLGMSHFSLRTKLRAALEEPAVELIPAEYAIAALEALFQKVETHERTD